MSFEAEVKQWTLEAQTKSRDVFVGSVMAVHESITVGSPLTGAPGQPVQQPGGGNLRASWQADIQGDVGTVSTNSAYAESNEDGIARPGGGPYRLLSSVGGRWSVALTRTNFSRLVDDVAAKLTAGGDPRPAGFQDNSVLGGSGS